MPKIFTQLETLEARVPQNGSWARNVITVMSVFHLLRFPWMTPFGLYSLWVLFSAETVRSFNSVVVQHDAHPHETLTQIGLRIQRYLAGTERDDGQLAEQLPEPLPTPVRRVATLQLFAMGGMVVIIGVALATGAVAIIVMPFVLGRRGVGIAMVSLFGFCTTALLTTFPFFSARGAARILRRDARGISPVSRVAWLTILAAIPLGFAGALGLNFATPDTVTNDGLSIQSKLFLIVLTAYVLLALWSIVVLRAYSRTLPNRDVPVKVR